MKNKIHINFILDVAMFVNLLIMAGIGFLIRYTLLPGYKVNEIYGRNVNLSFWNMDRHEWGRIHLILSLLFLLLLALHIILHWKAIACWFRKVISQQSSRKIVAPVFLVLSFCLLLFPFLVKPSIDVIGTRAGANRNSREVIALEGTETIPDDAETGAFAGSDMSPESRGIANHEGYNVDHGIRAFPVYGSMTLGEVSELYQVQVSSILSELNIPAIVHENTRMGQLRRRHCFTMSEVEKIVARHSNLPAAD